jgi:PAS domain S-box-containing protein
MSLAIVGCIFSLWQFRRVSDDVERVSRVERRLTAILELDNSALTLMNKLHRSADTLNAREFEAEARRQLDLFLNETGALKSFLARDIQFDTTRDALLLDNLTGIIDAVPSRIEAMVAFARAGDWTALHARLANEIDRTDDVASSLVREMKADLSAARQHFLDDTRQAKTRAVQILGLTGLLSFGAAALLGFVVTQSITRPLKKLDRAAAAIAAGRFGYEVPVTGSDELAQLAKVFNRMALDLKDLYDAAQRSEARFRALIEKASELILIVNRAGELAYVSPSGIRVLGEAPEKLIGRPIRDLVREEDVPLVGRVLSPLHLPPGSMQPFELTLRGSGGPGRILEGLASNLLEDPAVNGIVINARDISERRHTEHVLRQREEQLQEAQKMEAIGQLAGGVAHDFNNLLTAINGYTELLLAVLPPHDESGQYAKEIQHAGERAVDLTSQLLAFSKRQVLQPVVLDINEIVGRTEKLLRRVIGEDIELICRLAPDLGAVRADPTQIHQVLMNLCVNARDAMPLGGTLTIETTNVDSGAISGGNGAVGEPYVAVSVRDTGHGMDLETQRRAFEPFFTTKQKGKGTGLGLSIVYGVVKHNGGRIAIESEPGRGTTFRILFPRVEVPAERVEKAAQLSPSGGGETILLVEDQVEVRRFASTSLRSFGYRVIEASNGDEALRLHRAASAPIDLVLTDVIMPGITGVELSHRLQTLNPGLKIILVSGYADSVILRHGVLESGIAFLQKPYSAAALAVKIREVLGPAAGSRA